MKAIVIWIMIQSFVVGFIYTHILNEINNSTYECPANKISPTFGGIVMMLMPIALLTDAPYEIEEYCKKK